MKSAIWQFVRFWLIKRPLRPLAWPSPLTQRPLPCSFGSCPENYFEKPDGPAPASAVARKIVSGSPTGQLPAPKLRKRARATRPSEAVAPESFLGKPDGPDPQRQNDGNELSGSPAGQTQAQTFDDSSRREKWHATRPGRVSANPKP